MKEIKWNESLDLISPLSYILVTSISSNGKPNIMGIGWWTLETELQEPKRSRRICCMFSSRESS